MKTTLLLCMLPLLLASAAAALLGANHPCWDETGELDARKEAAGGVLPPGAKYPTCDRLGRYSPQQCKGSQCFCADPTGGQLANYSVPVWKQNTQACRCAREEHEVRQTDKVGISVSCDEKGDFEHTQCVGSQCYCVHSHTGEQLGGERFSGHVGGFTELSAKCKEAAKQQ